MQEVTKARQIWSKFIDDLVRDHKITPPEEEIESYTVEELEKWAATRNRAKDLRQGQRQLRFRSRILEEDGERIDWVGRGQILPGGRWLLASHNRYMYFYDLGAPLLESQVLLNSETMEEATVEYCVPWVDRSKERLTFFVATRVASPSKLAWYLSTPLCLPGSQRQTNLTHSFIVSSWSDMVRRRLSAQIPW